jgi:hypothetical protein
VDKSLHWWEQWLGGILIQKTLTSGDISTGSVVIPGNSTFFGQEIGNLVSVLAVTLIGSPVIRETDASSISTSGVSTLSTSSAVLATDMGIFMGSCQNSGGTLAETISPGTILQTQVVPAPGCAGQIASLQMPGGVTTVTFTNVGGVIQAVVIFEGIPTGVGSVTSVGMTVPSRQTVSGSPVTGAGTLAITDNSQSANLVFAGPASGSATAPTFRALVSADVPSSLTNPMTTEGDIIYGGASGAPTRLAAGTSGQVLQTNGSSAAPSWAAAGGGGGGMTQIAQQVLSSAAASITFSSIPGTYTNLVLARAGAFVSTGMHRFSLLTCSKTAGRGAERLPFRVPKETVQNSQLISQCMIRPVRQAR